MTARKKTTLAKLRAANQQIKGLAADLIRASEIKHEYAEALLLACDKDAGKAAGYVRGARLRQEEEARVRKMRQPNTPSEQFNDTFESYIESADYQIAQMLWFTEPHPFIANLTAPSGYP